MKKYRKRSDIVVEARQVTNDPVQARELAKWCESIAYASPGRVSIHVSTLEGLMVAHPGDYIIKGVKGEFYPCRQDIFEETYEEVKP